jgi:hypothetical protein
MMGGDLDRAFLADLASRLHGGSHWILYGPRGVGKSTLIGLLRDRYRRTGIPCGSASSTAGLADIIAALAEAYPGTDDGKVSRRAARVRLRSVADRHPGVLLLDHATQVTTAMLGYLRRLRGGTAGTLLVVDVDSQRERETMRAWHAGMSSVRMPLVPNRILHRRLAAAIHDHELPSIEARQMQRIIHLARGRIGWIAECAGRLQAPEYWRDERLHSALLCTDTEMAVRASRSGPRTLRRRAQT